MSWHLNWLRTDPTFSRQPYQQLASTFRNAGYPDRAEAVLYAMRDRERQESWRSFNLLRAIGLEVLRWTIGYGLTYRFPLFVILWTVVLAAVGAGVIYQSPNASKQGILWCIGASLDQLLPILKLDREFGGIFTEQRNLRLNDVQMFYFFIHTLLGYMLGTFVLAALAGLTQARR